MAAASEPEPILSPLVAQGRALIEQALQLKIECEALASRLKAKAGELGDVEEQLIALGAGRYCDPEAHTCTVVAAVPPAMQPDLFRLRSAEDAELARGCAGENFGKLFGRHVTFCPRPGFAGIAQAILTPAKARDLIALCIVPGQLAGGRRAHVRWK